jgi:hypothetical protein
LPSSRIVNAAQRALVGWRVRAQGHARPNVRAEATAAAGDGWPRKEDERKPLERPDVACRSGSPRARG